MEEDLAGTPVSGPSLTPPSAPSPVPPPTGFDFDRDCLVVEPAVEDVEIDPPFTRDGEEIDDEARALIASLEAANNARDAAPRRGRRLRALDLLAQDRAERVAQQGPEPTAVDMEEDRDESDAFELPPLALEDKPVEQLVPYEPVVDWKEHTQGPNTLVVGGYAHLSQVPESVSQQMNWLHNHPQPVDGAVYSFLKAKIKDPSMQGVSAEAKHANLDRRTCIKSRRRWAAMYYMAILFMRMTLERTLATTAARASVVYYFEWMRYDETPLPTRTEEICHRLLDAEPINAPSLAVSLVSGMQNKLQLASNSNAKTYCRQSRVSASLCKPLLVW